VSGRRFFVEGVHRRGETVTIEGSDAHHIADVLRLRSGDHVEVIDSAGEAFDAELSFNHHHVSAQLMDVNAQPVPARLRIDVAQAVPKGAKMDAIVEKATELGASVLLPFISERTIARETGDAKLARWRRIAQSAAEQCGRREMPAVLDPMPFAALLDRFCAYDCVLFAWESSKREALRRRLPELISGANSVLIVIGPEGGFSHAEADAAKERGAVDISLGPCILRTETAALALLAILTYITG
jgi:16S rRNA (uracil1498-N3)-methyltransferase